MAIGAITVDKSAGGVASAPVYADLMHFAGDSAYPTGGTASFQAAVRAKFNDSREVLGVIPQDCGGYMVVYDKANDKLKVFTGDYNPAADSPLVEVDNAENLSGVTFNLIVLSK